MCDFIAAVSPDIIEMTRLEALECGASHDEEACGDGESDGGGDSPQLSPLGGLRRSIPASEHGGDGEISQLTINVSTLSAPEVSLMPSPEVSKVGFFFSNGMIILESEALLKGLHLQDIFVFQ